MVGDQRCHVLVISLMNASNCSDSDPWQMVPSRRQSVIKVVRLMVLLRGDESSFDKAYFTILLNRPNSMDWLILACEPASYKVLSSHNTKSFNFQRMDERIAWKVAWILWLMAPVRLRLYQFYKTARSIKPIVTKCEQDRFEHNELLSAITQLSL